MAPLRPFSHSLPIALLRARESVMRHFRPSLQAAGLTEQQWRALRAFNGQKEIDATRLAGATFLLAPSLTRILRDLEGRGLVSRRPDPRDARVALIALTGQGAALLREVGARSERIYQAIEARVGGEKLGRLMWALAEIEADLGERLEI
ncbi:MAG TPA: homoprotocatechuate degradation operon regulator HpaR [Roseiarcus sp.]|nr:homoprotocatechuate degradation operon regulator HpaR [Roseiarcus sp.]